MAETSVTEATGGSGEPTPAKPDFFLKEAVSHHLKRGDVEGALLDLSSAWTRLTYWILLAVFAIVLTFLLVGEIDRYADGSAVVHQSTLVDVVSESALRIVSTLVEEGQQVREGDPLLKVEKLRHLEELARVNRLLDKELDWIPSGSIPSEDLRRLLQAKEGLEKEILEAFVRAPADGRVVRILTSLAGEISPNERVAVLEQGNDPDFSIVALFPAHVKPEFFPGASLRFRPAGYRATIIDARVTAVAEETVGRVEAERYLTTELPTDSKVSPSFCLVFARLEGNSFSYESREVPYFHGMTGHTELQVGREPLIHVLIPGLRNNHQAGE